MHWKILFPLDTTVKYFVYFWNYTVMNSSEYYDVALLKNNVLIS